MSLPIVTAENAQDIAKMLDEWRDTLTPEKRSLVDAHLDELRKLNDAHNRMPNLGAQSRRVCAAYFYMLYLEHVMEGKPMPKCVGEI